MSLNTWRQFQLFENIPIRDPYTESDSPLYSDPTLRAVASINESFLAIGLQSNTIKILNIHKMKVELEFNAYTDDYQLTYLSSVSETFILSLGESLGKPVQIKLWNIDKVPKSEGDYYSMSEVRNGANAFPVSAISSNLNFSCIAIGFTDGRIILIRGDMLRDRGTKSRVIYEDQSKEPITNLSFSNDCNHLFASTTTKTMLFGTSGKNRGQPDLVLNSTTGVDLNCAKLNQFTDEFICALKDRIDFYQSSGNKHSLVIEIPTVKRVFPISKDHVLLLTSDIVASGFSADNLQQETTKILILDIRNKIVSLTLLLSSNVLEVLIDPSAVSLVTTDGVIHKLKQKQIDEQLNIICSREIFPIALTLAKQNNVPLLRIQEIHKAYGDFLFKKNMKHEAIKEYVQSLDVSDPTEVISKFGVERKTSTEDSINLKDFIWELVKNGLATSDHITLLLTILIKLEDLDGIDFFYEHFTREGTFVESAEILDNFSMSNEEYFYFDKDLFDLETILKLLIESGLRQKAYNLALKFSKDPVTVVEILLKELKESIGALTYIKSLPVDDALRVLIKFSKLLLNHMPNQTNLLLIDLFTGKYKPKDYSKNDGKVVLEQKETEVFYNYSSFFEFMKPSSQSRADIHDNGSTDLKSTYHPPKPSLIFPSFVQNPFEFVVFLEACLESYKTFEGYEQDRQDILTTLYDMYLSLSEDDIEQRKSEWKQKAEFILRESKTLSSNLKAIDSSLTLLISHMHDMDIFSASSLLERGTDSTTVASNMSISDVFRSMCLTNDPKDCLQFLQKYGDKDTDLYKIAMSHFSSSKHVYEEIGGEKIFKDNILSKVIELDLMSPLEIIQTLSSTSVVQYGLVKEFLVEFMKNEGSEIEKNKILVESYESELSDKKKTLEEALAIKNPLQIKVKNRFCDACRTLLEPPIVYFKCGHLYHQRCLNQDEDPEVLYRCPRCLAETETTRRAFKTFKDSSQKANLLRAALSDSEGRLDRFAIVTDFIGRGGLNDPAALL